MSYHDTMTTKERSVGSVLIPHIICFTVSLFHKPIVAPPVKEMHCSDHRPNS